MSMIGACRYQCAVRFILSAFLGIKGSARTFFGPPYFDAGLSNALQMSNQSWLPPLAGDTARAATSSEVTDRRREARTLKEIVAEQALELRLLKNVWAAPSARAKIGWLARSALTYPVSGFAGPRWGSARARPHKHDGREGHFFTRLLNRRIDLQAICSTPPQAS